MKEIEGDHELMDFVNQGFYKHPTGNFTMRPKQISKSQKKTTSVVFNLEQMVRQKENLNFKFHNDFRVAIMFQHSFNPDKQELEAGKWYKMPIKVNERDFYIAISEELLAFNAIKKF
mmetsp:Transcript_266/g.470  ORF Transcript_266/g.470 Transcript_266/m.470 type:complete len:117 (+) Transcript_266:601-951(+)